MILDFIFRNLPLLFLETFNGLFERFFLLSEQVHCFDELVVLFSVPPHASLVPLRGLRALVVEMLWRRIFLACHLLMLPLEVLLGRLSIHMRPVGVHPVDGASAHK